MGEKRKLRDFQPIDDTEPKPLVVVRLTTSAYDNDKGFFVKKELRYLKRKCQGWNCLEDFCDNGGANATEECITNLYEVPDGIYTVVMSNISRDYETGVVDDWDLTLVPYKEETKENEK